MLADRILHTYGLFGATPLQVEKGYRNESHAALLPDGHQVNVIIYKAEPGILATLKRANLVGDYLARQGYPARYTYDQRIIRLGMKDKVRYAGIYQYLPGHTIPWDAYTMEHLKQLGGSMGAMHQSLKNAPFILENQVVDEYTAITQRMRTYFSQPEIQRALEAKLHVNVSIPNYFFALLKGCARLSGQQPLHMDFVRGNILFDDTAQITGVLDFEKAAWGHPVFDIARTYAFLLVDCKHKTEAQVRKYFLSSGYNKRGMANFKITTASSTLLEQLVDLFLLYDFYKFLRHNPYESLAQNEHFVRTRALLLQRQLLAHTTKTPHTIFSEEE
ncbi:MAG TPA: phosphotransferase [Verrucomicrobiae bacterium]|nr:phosphotransferase [Verrucomicrobiae bacterium]